MRRLTHRLVLPITAVPRRRYSFHSLPRATTPLAPASATATVSLTNQTRWCSISTGKSDPAAALKRPEIAAQMNEWTDSFAEARELIKDAMDSVGTTYFSEDIEDASAQTKDTLDKWAALCEALTKSGDGATVERLEREHGMKMKQLAEELEAAKHAGGE